MRPNRIGGNWTTAGALALFSSIAGCDGSTCASGCPKLGEPATDEDIRLVLSGNQSLGGLEVGDEFFAGPLAGDLVLRTARPDCVASPDSPCRYTLLRLEVRPEGFATERMSHVKLAIEVPLEFVDVGNGLIIDDGTVVHSCLRADDAEQHGSAPADSATSINYDASTDSASIEAAWPLVFSDSESDCRERGGRLSITGRFEAVP